MATLGTSNNQVNVLVKSTADTSGINQTVGGLNTLDSAALQSAAATSKLTSAVAVGAVAYEAFKNSLGSAKRFLDDSVNAANAYQSAIIGLSSVTTAFGGDAQAASRAAQDLASDGLLTVRDAATGLKNLLASGFSLPEAIKLMNAFKDSASFNRQAALGFGESIRGATEGIKNGNSILVDNAGITKNLSVILQQAGKSQQDVMNIQSDASVRQAAYNGILREAAAFQGDAARYSDTYAGAQSRAAAQATILKQNVGAVVQMIQSPLINAVTNFVSQNQQMIISFGAAAGASLAAAGGIYVVIAAIRAFSLASLVAAATNPLLAVLTVIASLAGVVVYNAVNKMQGKIGDMNKSMTDTGKIGGGAMSDGLGKAGKAAADLAEKLGDIDKQIGKSNRDFQEQLAEMVKGHEDKVRSLSLQLEDENKSFKAAAAKDEKDFAESQKKQAEDHEDKVDKIKKQITKLSDASMYANREQIADLQDQLATENTAYAEQEAKRLDDRKNEQAADKEAHDKKVSDLQSQLDAESSLLQKHAADVSSIRNVTMLDEIDKLKRTHDEQIAAFEDQKSKAIQSSAEAASGVVGNWNNAAAQLAASDQFKSSGNQMGTAMANAFKQAIGESIKNLPRDIANFVLDPFKKAAAKSSKSIDDYMNNLKDAVVGMSAPHFSTGVRNFEGGMAVVGDVNGQGGELINLPPGSDVYSNRESKQIMRGGSRTTRPITVTQNIYNNVDFQKGIAEIGWKLRNA